MTRATLLHVLDRPTDLGPAEVRELEQLAQAFPYCQTAHLLLAKAAHDQGTMLAGQRLRRAATYAADRSLLRRLIEQAAPEAVAPEPVDPEGVAQEASDPPLPTPEPAPLPELLPVVEASVAPEAAPAPAAAAELRPNAAAAVELLVATPSPPAVAPPLPAVLAPPVAAPQPSALIAEAPAAALPVVVAAPTPPVVAVAAADVPATIPAPLPALPPVAEMPPVAALVEKLLPLALPSTPVLPLPEPPAPTPVPPVEAEVSHPATAETPLPPAQPVPLAPVAAPAELRVPAAPFPSENDEPELEPAAPAVAAPMASPAAAHPVVEVPAAGEIRSEPVAEATPAIAPPDEIPAQAPAIRPSVEVGEARFEFGLAEAPPTAATTYELPGLIDEWAASAVTRSLGPAGALAGADVLAAPPVFTPAAFTGDAMVGYAFGESSRLGLSMQLLDLLAAKAEAAESATAVVALAQPQATALPPTGTFFEPDPLLLDHWATHRPATPELPSSIDLINNFLKRQPRLTRPGMLPPSPGGQADLSVRSTSAEPDLVSENLARIFVRQGKTARAIEIYQKLIVKQPEKMAYFTAQIQQLQSPD